MVQINLVLLMALGAAMIGVSSRILVTPLIWFGMAFVLPVDAGCCGIGLSMPRHLCCLVYQPAQRYSRRG